MVADFCDSKHASSHALWGRDTHANIEHFHYGYEMVLITNTCFPPPRVFVVVSIHIIVHVNYSQCVHVTNDHKSLMTIL